MTNFQSAQQQQLADVSTQAILNELAKRNRQELAGAETDHVRQGLAAALDTRLAVEPGKRHILLNGIPVPVAPAAVLVNNDHDDDDDGLPIPTVNWEDKEAKDSRLAVNFDHAGMDQA